MKPLNVSSGFLVLNEVELGIISIRLSNIAVVRAYNDGSTALFMASGNMFYVRESAEEILATIGGENEKTAKE